LIGSAFSRDEMKVIGDGILDACDAQDGLKDGMVHDIRGCRFNPMNLVCAAGQTQACLSPAKATVVDKLFAGATLSNGTRFYSDWPYDPGVNNPGWLVWRIGLNPTAMPPTAVNATLIPGSLAYAFTTPPDQPTDLFDYALAYNADTGVPKISARSGIFKESADEHSNPTSTNLDAFKARRGKLIFFHGMADPIFSAKDTVRYVEALQARDGAAQLAQYARLYLVPGMTHCSGGPATDKFELLQPMMDWVEKGMAPGAISAEAGPQSPWPKRTRPLCTWPQQAFYKGQGNGEEAASFVCR
jgi:Tannase and feruloyl esterase